MSDNESSWSYHLIAFKVDSTARGGLKQTVNFKGILFSE